jgi:hypothetical protein
MKVLNLNCKFKYLLIYLSVNKTNLVEYWFRVLVGLFILIHAFEYPCLENLKIKIV